MTEDKHIQIISACHQLFLRYGVKSVTMDDIARELGMSKKTLYVYFKDKKDLIMKVVSGYLDYHRAQMDAIFAKKLNAIDELFEIYAKNKSELGEMKAMVLFELRKYYPEAWKKYENFKRSYIPSCVEENLNRGKKEGLYRNNLNSRIIAIAYTNLVNLIFESDQFGEKEFDFKTLYLELFYYHIRGIASEKGNEYIDMQMKKMGLSK